MLLLQQVAIDVAVAIVCLPYAALRHYIMLAHVFRRCRYYCRWLRSAAPAASYA